MVAKSTTTKAVATREQAKPPADMSGYEQYAGAGLDDLTNEDKGLPFFEVLQPNSPEVEEITGAKPGMIINKATKELFESIVFVPVCRQHVYTEWVNRQDGGGFVGQHELTSGLVKEARAKQRVGKHILPNKNELIETFYLYGLVMASSGDFSPAVIAFTSTKIAAYKTLTTRADSLMFTAKDGRKLKFPWFAHAWKLGTEKKKKDKYTWFTWTVDFNCESGRPEDARLPPDHPAVELAAAINDSYKSGSLKVNTDGLSNEGGTADEGASGGSSDSNDPPF